MEVLPAIDLLGGKVVRLTQGDYDRVTVYADDPVEVASQFVAAGCKWIHVVDLDAARSGELTNTEAIARVAGAAGISIQVGGGVRSDEAVYHVLEAGARRVIVGSAALENWRWFESLLRRGDLAGRVALGLDARGGRLAIKGWLEQMETTAVELVRRVHGLPLAAVIYTDIQRDGTLIGPNLDATDELVEASDAGVIASGGVGRMADISACRAVGCAGVIVGRAYYEGKIDLRGAILIAKADN